MTSRMLPLVCGVLTILNVVVEAHADTIPEWVNSYAEGNQCYCSPSIDSRQLDKIFPTPVGGQSLRQICQRVGSGPALRLENGNFNYPAFRDIQCGNTILTVTMPVESSQCPGRISVDSGDCLGKGPKWNLRYHYAKKSVANEESVSPSISTRLAETTTKLVLSEVSEVPKAVTPPKPKPVIPEVPESAIPKVIEVQEKEFAKIDDHAITEKSFVPQSTVGLQVKGRIRMEYALNRNADIDDVNNKDSYQLKPTAKFGFTYVKKNYKAKMVLLSAREIDVDDESGDRSYESTLDIEEAYVEYSQNPGAGNRISDASLAIGRVDFGDARSWLYDRKLDGLFYGFQIIPADTALEISISRRRVFVSNLLESTNPDRTTNIVLLLERRPFKNKSVKLGAYAIAREDPSKKNNSPRFFALRSMGLLWSKRFSFWSDIAVVKGKYSEKKISGYGLDFGGTYRLQIPMMPYITFGYAYGSGDGDTNTDFRQTDLHSNSGKFGGLASFKYYGEMLNPDLSNLHILTAGIGVRPIKQLSIDLIYHTYRQDHALDKLRDSDLDERPDGLHKQIGDALDLVIGYRTNRKIKTELTIGWFRPGRAFSAAATDGYLVDARVTYPF